MPRYIIDQTATLKITINDDSVRSFETLDPTTFKNAFDEVSSLYPDLAAADILALTLRECQIDCSVSRQVGNN